jgi:hypothetical protein
MELISETRQKANKEYNCDACELVEGCNMVTFSLEEKRQIANAMKNNQKIQKGEMYIRQCVKDSGGLYTFRAILEIHKICCKYELYVD